MPKWNKKAGKEKKAGKSVWLWEAHLDVRRLFTLEINRWKVNENKWEERWERREEEGPDCYLPCREAYLPAVFFKKTFPSGSSYLAPARQLWQGNTLGLIWFVLVVLEMLQLWETGGWWFNWVSLILFLFFSQPSWACFPLLFCSFFTCFAVFLPPRALLSAGVKLCDFFYTWIRALPRSKNEEIHSKMLHSQNGPIVLPEICQIK